MPDEAPPKRKTPYPDPMSALQGATSIHATGEYDPRRPGVLEGLVGAAGTLKPVTEAEPVLHSIGKSISDLLGAVFKPTSKGTGLPARLSLENWNARTGNVILRGARAAGEKFEATPAQLDELISSGELTLDTGRSMNSPQAKGIQQRISDALDAENQTRGTLQSRIRIPWGKTAKPIMGER